MTLSGLAGALDGVEVASLLDRGFRGLAKAREHWHAPVGDRRTIDRLTDGQRASTGSRQGCGRWWSRRSPAWPTPGRCAAAGAAVPGPGRLPRRGALMCLGRWLHESPHDASVTDALSGRLHPQVHASEGDQPTARSPPTCRSGASGPPAPGRTRSRPGPPPAPPICSEGSAQVAQSVRNSTPNGRGRCTSGATRNWITSPCRIQASSTTSSCRKRRRINRARSSPHNSTVMARSGVECGQPPHRRNQTGYIQPGQPPDHRVVDHRDRHRTATQPIGEDHQRQRHQHHGSDQPAHPGGLAGDAATGAAVQRDAVDEASAESQQGGTRPPGRLPGLAGSPTRP